MAETILQQSQMLDPVAGNNIFNQIGTSLTNKAKETIDDMMKNSIKQRSRMRRRRELAGD